MSLPSVSDSPLASLGVVTHIGTLDVSDKNHRGDSYEGTGLSFSEHPEEWDHIAKLGGSPWWEVDLAGRRLIDGHEFLEAHADALAQWGVEQGLLVQSKAYEVRWFDDEMDCELCFWLETEDAAIEEADSAGLYDPDNGVLGYTVIDPCWSGTAALSQAMGHQSKAKGQDANILQDVLTVWAERQGADGLWWADELNTDRYSAPRGVVFASIVPQLDFIKVREVEVRPGRRSGPR